MNILSAIQSFEKKHINLTIFIGIAIGVGVGMYLYACLVPGMPGVMGMYRFDKYDSMHNKLMGTETMMYKHSMSKNTMGEMMGMVVSEKQFLEEMITHHEAAVRMSHQLLGLSGVSEQSAKLANDIIVSQSAEIDMMKGWLASPAGTQ